MIELKKDEGANDVNIWEWLLKLVGHLGADGMSSEESGVEANEEGVPQKVYRVKIMPWRRNIDRELAIIDKARLQDKELYSDAGAKPVPRKRSEQNNESSREPVCDLPRVLYDDSWFDRLNHNFRECTLRVSKKQFQWFERVAAQAN
jgi:hypothetical protein